MSIKKVSQNLQSRYFNINKVLLIMFLYFKYKYDELNYWKIYEVIKSIKTQRFINMMKILNVIK